MEHYDEYLGRARWQPAEKLHDWLASRVVNEFDKRAALKERNVLEIGTGTARLAKALKQKGVHSYNGIEPNKALAEYSRMQGFNIHEQALPDLSIDFENKFDHVISLHVLEHAPTYLDARQWVQEMIRVTKPGGYILIATPNVMDYQNFFWDSDWSHGFPTTPKRITQIFNDLKVNVKYSGSMHLGSTSVIAALMAHFISFVIPTKLVDFATMRLVKRPLASGIKIALLWGLTFVVAQKPEESI